MVGTVAPASAHGKRGTARTVSLDRQHSSRLDGASVPGLVLPAAASCVPSDDRCAMTDLSLLHPQPRAGRATFGLRLRDGARMTVRSLCALIRAWHQRAVARHRLRAMDPHMLRDIGLTPADAWDETRKPWWRA
jgi:uncharacterized protein YjiS (DUF1127 family)